MDPYNPITAPPLFILDNHRGNPNVHHSQHVGFSGPQANVIVGLTKSQRKIHGITDHFWGDSCGKALVDTGAVATMFNQKIVQSLGILPNDKVALSTSYSGPTTVATYSLQIKFKGYHFNVYKAPTADLDAHNLIAIIGRDILHLGNLNYFGEQGEWDFKMPRSLPKTD